MKGVGKMKKRMRNAMNKRWSKLAPAVALALIIASCSAGATPPPAPPPTATAMPATPAVQAVAEPAEVAAVKLTYISQTVEWNEAFHNEAEKKLIEQFEGAYPGISLTVGAKQDLWTHQFLENNSHPPDIIADTFETFPAIRRGMILDISDIWQDQDLVRAFPADFKALGEWNGKQYYLPVFTSWTAVYYNKELFARYGLQPPQTWAEFLAASDTLVAQGVTPVALGWFELSPATLWIDYLDLRLNGPEFHTKLVRGEQRYDDPGVRKVFEAWKALSARNYFSKNAASMRMPDSVNEVLAGKAAMVLADSTDIGRLPAQDQAKLDFFPFPIMDTAVPLGEVGMPCGYVIPAKSQHPEEAMAFVHYVASLEGQTALMQRAAPNVGILPVNRQVDPASLSDNAKRGLALVQEAKHFGIPYISTWATAGNYFNTGYATLPRFFRDPDKNLDNTLVDLEKFRQRAFKQ
jgi:ABC-type glycerol-3-phosphate transport system substrate-binding protein